MTFETLKLGEGAGVLADDADLDADAVEVVGDLVGPLIEVVDGFGNFRGGRSRNTRRWRWRSRKHRTYSRSPFRSSYRNNQPYF